MEETALLKLNLLAAECVRPFCIVGTETLARSLGRAPKVSQIPRVVAGGALEDQTERECSVWVDYLDCDILQS